MLFRDTKELIKHLVRLRLTFIDTVAAAELARLVMVAICLVTVRGLGMTRRPLAARYRHGALTGDDGSFGGGGGPCLHIMHLRACAVGNDCGGSEVNRDH